MAAATRQRYKTTHPRLSTFMAAENSELSIRNTIIFYDLQPAGWPVSGFRERDAMFKRISLEPGVSLAHAPRRLTTLGIGGPSPVVGQVGNPVGNLRPIGNRPGGW